MALSCRSSTRTRANSALDAVEVAGLSGEERADYTTLMPIKSWDGSHDLTMKKWA
jgi:hypothetical protein